MAPMRSLAVALVGLVGLTAAFIPSQIPRHNVHVPSKSFPKAVAPVRVAAAAPPSTTLLCFTPSLPPSHTGCAFFSFLRPKLLASPIHLLAFKPPQKLTFHLPSQTVRLSPSREGWP